MPGDDEREPRDEGTKRYSPSYRQSLEEEDELRIQEPQRVGQYIGSYCMVRCLGRGGMGVVYEAEHKEIGKRVAVKILAARLAHEESYRRRFLREAKAGSKVLHPGLVQIFDHGLLDDGTPYILMEYLQGRPLRALMAQELEGRLPLRAALSIGKQIAEALQAAHDGGVVHRDLKPENVMLVSDPEATRGERARVLDFGIAKLLRVPDLRTLPSGGPLGTPTYMSPEQCRGDLDIDGRADVYALGVMLYEMLCGRPPFLPDPEQPQRVVFRHVFDHPRPPRQILAELPLPVEALVLRMLAKDPAGRPTMAEVAAELSRLAAQPFPQRAERSDWRHRLRRYGTRFAMPISMLLLLAIPFLFEILYYLHHRDLWWPGHQATMARIQGARFVMGSTLDEIDAASGSLPGNTTTEIYFRETPERRVEVSTFFMDIYEVTNSEYAKWLNNRRMIQVESARLVKEDGALLLDLYQAHYVGIEHVDGRFRARPGMERLPVVQVSWDGAARYCESQKKRLPSEAEWELAARGVEGRHFPWGDQKPTCGSAVFDWATVPGLRCGWRVSGPAVVGSMENDQSPEGIYDLGGNVAEWVLDYYREHYPKCGERGCVNPVVSTDSNRPSESGRRVVRGGAWYREFDSLRGAGRSRAPQNRPAGDIGFRCVSSDF